MCGRFSISQPGGIPDRFGIFPGNLDVAGHLAVPRYNIAPTQEIPAIINSSGNQLQMLRWGLIPRWAREISIGTKMINARGETLREKPSFRDSLQRRRCLIPADGFYEWQRQGAAKLPYRITLKTGELFGFAGLWDSWKSPAGEVINSCTIITTFPNELLEPIHDRMPVILPTAAEQIWLDPSITDSLLLGHLLKPYPPELMRAYRVSPVVNSPRNDSPECLSPVEKTKNL